LTVFLHIFANFYFSAFSYLKHAEAKHLLLKTLLQKKITFPKNLRALKKIQFICVYLKFFANFAVIFEKTTSHNS
jgi:hypothetical protein